MSVWPRTYGARIALGKHRRLAPILPAREESGVWLPPDTTRLPLGLPGHHRVTDGARTRDHRDHNAVLYQLSYSHHGDGVIAMGMSERQPTALGSVRSYNSPSGRRAGWGEGLAIFRPLVTIPGLEPGLPATAGVPICTSLILYHGEVP